MTTGFASIAVADMADKSAIPAADLAALFHAIGQRREAGLCGRHQHRTEPGCDAVAVWANGRGTSGDDRPAAVFCRDDRGQYRAFNGDGQLMATGSILDVIRLWK